MPSSSDSENDNLTLAERNQKKHLKAAGALKIPKPTSYVVSQKTTDSEKGTQTLTSVSQKAGVIEKGLLPKASPECALLVKGKSSAHFSKRKRASISLTQEH